MSGSSKYQLQWKCVKLKLFVRIRQQTIFSCVYEFIVTSGQLFPVHGELNNTVLK